MQVHKDSKEPFLMSGCKVADGRGTMLVKFFACYICLILIFVCEYFHLPCFSRFVILFLFFWLSDTQFDVKSWLRVSHNFGSFMKNLISLKLVEFC